MRMGKATPDDIEMATSLTTLLEQLERGRMPAEKDGEESVSFDDGDPENCQVAMERIFALLRTGSLSRVVWGLYVLLDPENAIVDPDDSCLELHPHIKAALAAAENADNDSSAALRALLDSDVGKTTLAKLADGQGTDTADGRAWLHAAELSAASSRSNSQ